MPKFVAQPADLGALPTLLDEKSVAKRIRVGINKWMIVRDDIEHVLIGTRRFYTEQAILDFLRRNTRKPAAAEPPPRKRVPPKRLSARKAERRPSA